MNLSRESNSAMPINENRYFIGLSKGSEQIPRISFTDTRYKPLELFFNESERRLDYKWYKDIIKSILKLKQNSTPLYLDAENRKKIIKYKIEYHNTLTSKLKLLELETNPVEVKDSYFLLELVKYYNAKTLFSSIGHINSKFDEIKIIEQDIVSITIRKNHCFVSEYFTTKNPLLIETSKLLLYFDHWFEFIKNWIDKGNAINQ